MGLEAIVMSTASPQIARSDTPGTYDIPFIGWSNAAQEFRTEVFQFALSGSVRPLIIGDPGVGKKTMAKAWLALSPHDEERALTFVDLNRRSFLPPGRYIGVTTYRPSSARYVAVMGKGIQEQLPEGSGPVSRLLEAFWYYFDFAMYMPPLRAGREIDVLAFLEYWHRARAARAGLRYHNVSASLLHRMIFGDWPDNLDGIYIYLRMLGHADRIEHAGTIKPAGTLEIETLREAPRQGTIAMTESSEDVPGCEPEMSEDEDIPFQALRDIAVRMYLWSCCQEPIDADTPGVTQACSLEKVPLSQFLSGLTAQEFLQLDEEQFIRDHVLPNAPMSLSERGDRFMLLLHRINHKRIFGTSFKALKTGLSIDPGWVDARLRCAAEPACTASVCAAQLRGIAACGPEQGLARPGAKPASGELLFYRTR